MRGEPTDKSRSNNAPPKSASKAIVPPGKSEKTFDKMAKGGAVGKRPIRGTGAATSGTGYSKKSN